MATNQVAVPVSSELQLETSGNDSRFKRYFLKQQVINSTTFPSTSGNDSRFKLGTLIRYAERRKEMNEYLEMILIASPLLILGVAVAGAAYWMCYCQDKG